MKKSSMKIYKAMGSALADSIAMHAYEAFHNRPLDTVRPVGERAWSIALALWETEQQAFLVGFYAGLAMSKDGAR